MSAEETSGYWVRVRPHNPQKGQKVRNYTIFGNRFPEGEWRPDLQLTDEQVAVLRDLRNDESNSESKPVFDVCSSREEAEALVVAEEDAKQPKLAALSPSLASGVRRPGRKPAVKAEAKAESKSE